MNEYGGLDKETWEGIYHNTNKTWCDDDPNLTLKQAEMIMKDHYLARAEFWEKVYKRTWSYKIRAYFTSIGEYIVSLGVDLVSKIRPPE
tara:strand:+ start:535 stop:801 length:267 start_codon:yes stop_codon:yes gene_type:complete